MNGFELTREDMLAMIFAHFCQQQPDMTPLEAAVMGLEDAETLGDNETARQAAIEKLERGAMLLKGYGLVYAPGRVLKGLPPLDGVPSEAVGGVMIGAGHIGTAEAERFVYAVRRVA